jgi:hypothetical protein
MNGYYWKVESAPSLRILLLFFSLFASISLTPSEFIDCQRLFPDENLDFLGIGEVSQKQSHACRVPLFIPSPSATKYFFNSHLLVVAFSSPSMNSRMELAIIMRC